MHGSIPPRGGISQRKGYVANALVFIRDRKKSVGLLDLEEPGLYVLTRLTMIFGGSFRPVPARHTLMGCGCGGGSWGKGCGDGCGLGCACGGGLSLGGLCLPVVSIILQLFHLSLLLLLLMSVLLLLMRMLLLLMFYEQLHLLLDFDLRVHDNQLLTLQLLSS